MASTIDKIKNDIIEAMNASQKRTSAYDTEAEIVRVDGDTAWVHIAGGVSETPVALTINAKKGDKVQVRVSNDGAWITGNATAPPTDDAVANIANVKAIKADVKAGEAYDLAEQAEKLGKENAEEMAIQVLRINDDIADLQDQIDGNITTWFYGYAPTLNNPPVTVDPNVSGTGWDTDAKKDEHLGDLFYNTTTGYAYRFMKENNVYSWSKITDSDVIEALRLAGEAQDTADSKRRVFYNTPAPPYDLGDLWVQGSNGDILRCATAKTSAQSYDLTDWILASKYTDDTLARSVQQRVVTAEGNIETIEGNITSLNNRVTTAEEDITTAEGNITSLGNRVTTAEGDITSAEGSITTLQGRIADAETDIDSVEQGLVQAQQDIQTAATAAESAQQSANAAGDSALSALNSSMQALDKLSVVENVVGVLDIISKNGEYALTEDTEIQADKWYFTRTGSGTSADPYVYTVVANPVVADIASYYELVSINQAIQNYVSSHLALTNDGLYLQNGATRILLSTTDGLVLYDQTGKQIANYGTEAVIGDPQGFHITITPNYNNTGLPRLSFYRDAVNEIAYISGDKLYITQSVVLQQMDVGTKVNAGGLGQWSWKVHEVSDRNNLYLKWLG